MSTKELKIKVPWGYVAAKTWGDERNPPIVALHGWQDNANSFDPLIPLLPANYYYICLDLPSHGQSTHMPVQTFITSFDFVLSLKFVLDELNLKRYILLGHSFGAQTAVVFTQIYPDYVSKLIMLDAIYYLPVYPKYYLNMLKDGIDNYDKCHKQVDTAPSYTFDEIVKKIISSRFVPISEEGAKVIASRSIIPVAGNKFKISTAQHLKYWQKPPLTIQYESQLVKSHMIHCPHLIIVASQTIIINEVFKAVLKEFRKNPFFKLINVEGTHDVHIEHPDRVAPDIETFLLNKGHKL